MNLKKVISGISLIMFLLCIQNATAQERLRIDVSGGYGYRFGEVSDNLPNDVEEYAKELKNGAVFSINAGYFIKENWGLGMYFSQFYSDNSATFRDAESGATVSTSDDITLTLIAPQFLYRTISSNGKHNFITTFSLGYLDYKNESTFESTDINFEGGSLGIAAGLNYDFMLSKNIAIGAGFKVIAGSISEFKVSANGQSQTVKVEEFSGEERENLSHLVLSAGLKFYL